MTGAVGAYTQAQCGEADGWLANHQDASNPLEQAARNRFTSIAEACAEAAKKLTEVVPEPKPEPAVPVEDSSSDLYTYLGIATALAIGIGTCVWCCCRRRGDQGSQRASGSAGRAGANDGAQSSRRIRRGASPAPRQATSGSSNASSSESSDSESGSDVSGDAARRMTAKKSVTAPKSSRDRSVSVGNEESVGGRRATDSPSHTEEVPFTPFTGAEISGGAGRKRKTTRRGASPSGAAAKAPAPTTVRRRAKTWTRPETARKNPDRRGRGTAASAMFSPTEARAQEGELAAIAATARKTALTTNRAQRKSGKDS